MRPSRRQTPPYVGRWSPGHPSMTVLLVAIHAGAFASQWMLKFIEPEYFIASNWLQHWLALSGEGIAHGNYWQFATFGFLHQGVFHAAANLLLLFFAGREIEPIVGRRPFILLFLGANFLGGLVHWLLMPEVPLAGISAGVAAVVAAYATVLPELELSGNLFFVIPLRMRAKFLMPALVTAAGLCWIAVAARPIGPAAMLAGVALGWFTVRRLGFGNSFAIERYFAERRQRAARLERMGAAQFVAEEMDPILEKIALKGMASLTRAERRILEQGREKMASAPAKK